MELTRKQSKDYQNKIIAQIEQIPDKVILFTEFEDDLIRKYYAIKGSAIADAIGKTRKQVSSRATFLGVAKRRSTINEKDNKT